MLPEFGNFFPFLELFSHFKLHFALIAFGFGVIATIAHCFKTGVLAFVMVAAIIIEIWPRPYPLETPDITPRSSSFKIIDLNVQKSNPDPNAVIEFIRQENATFVALQEVIPVWQDRLRTLSDSYPFMEFNNDGLKCCIALLSKVPWESVKSVKLSAKGPDIIDATFNIGDRRFSVLVTHLDPPKPSLFGYKFHHHHQTEVLGKTLKSFSSPFILVGDLNTTHWAPSFKRIIQGTTLRRMGGGISATWLSKYILAGLPLDHILATKEFLRTKFFIGPSVQSDHFPLVAELTL
ncbi:MAG: endonuclease/exonuclease/phosphatase family protein [Pseudomonadota bacterium]|nr:endonuclease/exonuclease/phosphatase family protein [Pseudomonadota bacterium]